MQNRVHCSGRASNRTLPGRSAFTFFPFRYGCAAVAVSLPTDRRTHPAPFFKAAVDHIFRFDAAAGGAKDGIEAETFGRTDPLGEVDMPVHRQPKLPISVSPVTPWSFRYLKLMGVAEKVGCDLHALCRLVSALFVRP